MCKKRYVQDGTKIEATSVELVVSKNGTELTEASITDAANLKVWEDDDWQDVNWDCSVTPARLYYV